LIRTFWFAAFCLSTLGGLLAAKLTSSIAIAEESVMDPTMLGFSRADDTLTKADRLEVAYLLPSARMPSAAMAPRWPTESIAVSQAMPGTDAKTALQPHRASFVTRETVMLPRPRPKIWLAKIRLAKNSHPAKPIVDVKTCSHADRLGAILMSFAGSPPCS
jgi:hypothetical protein